MTISKPGEFITAKCGRCNDITGHVVMLVLDGEIAKVECKACGSIHKHRAIKKVISARSSSSAVRHVKAGQVREQAVEVGRTSAPKRPSTSKSAALRGAAKLHSAWQEAMVRHTAETPTSYSMNGTFLAGEFMEHSTFGRGEVIGVPSAGKVEVLFEDGVKALRCGA